MPCSTSTSTGDPALPTRQIWAGQLRLAGCQPWYISFLLIDLQVKLPILPSQKAKHLLARILTA